MANVSWIFHIWRIWEYWSWGESPENTSTGIFHRTNSCPTKNIQQISPRTWWVFLLFLASYLLANKHLSNWTSDICIYICIYSCLFAAAASYPSCRHVSPQPRGHASFNCIRHLWSLCGTSLGQWMHWWHNKLFHSVNETWPWKIHSMVYIYIYTYIIHCVFSMGTRGGTISIAIHSVFYWNLFDTLQVTFS